MREVSIIIVWKGIYVFLTEYFVSNKKKKATKTIKFFLRNMKEYFIYIFFCYLREWHLFSFVNVHKQAVLLALVSVIFLYFISTPPHHPTPLNSHQNVSLCFAFFIICQVLFDILLFINLSYTLLFFLLYAHQRQTFESN